MGGLFAALIILGVGALVLGAKDKGPKPRGMIGTPVLRIISGAHVLTVTRHGQGYAWYVARGSDVLKSSNEGDQRGAVTVGLEALQGYVTAGAKMRISRLVEPLAVGTVEPVGAAQGPWRWAVELGQSGQEPSRPEAILALLAALRGEPAGEGATDEEPPDVDEGIVGEPAQLQAGIQISGDCMQFDVVDLDAWMDAAAPAVSDAIEAEISDTTELADAVFGFVLGCDTDGLSIGDEAWSPALTEKDLEGILVGQYVDVVAPDRKLAAALVHEEYSEPGQAGIKADRAWVARPSNGPQSWEWLVFADRLRGLDSDAIDGGPANSLVDARQQAKDKIHEIFG